uniref:Uncharacterized protein n=1 Tax=Panagrolaimus sp. PS1159 TaxID=55785 RepID=A0AC35G1N2_9BILA
MVVSRNFLILLAIFVSVGLCNNESLSISTWKDKIGREEATCRFQLSKMDTWLFYVISAGICTLSLVFLIMSIGVFIYIQRYLMKEMEEAVYKAHEVMDSVMVCLIPQQLIDEIGSEDRMKKKDS